MLMDNCQASASSSRKASVPDNDPFKNTGFWIFNIKVPNFKFHNIPAPGINNELSELGETRPFQYALLVLRIMRLTPIEPLIEDNLRVNAVKDKSISWDA